MQITFLSRQIFIFLRSNMMSKRAHFPQVQSWPTTTELYYSFVVDLLHVITCLKVQLLQKLKGGIFIIKKYQLLSVTFGTKWKILYKASSVLPLLVQKSPAVKLSEQKQHKLQNSGLQI